MSNRWLAVLGIALVVAGCVVAVALLRPRSTPDAGDGRDHEDGPVWFDDVTERVGLNFVHQAARPSPYFMPGQVGSGGALFDFDGDGRLDLYLVQNAGPQSAATNRLFHQETDGTFRDVSAGSGLDVAGHGMGVAVGDANNDGQPDVVVTEYQRTRLFLNRGRGKFEDASEAGGVSNPAWGTSAAFLDFDRDGWLDLVVANYVTYDPTKVCAGVTVEDFCSPRNFAGTPSRLFRNLGPQPGGAIRFADVSAASGIGKVPGPGLGVVVFDCDGDGWPDVFVANDGKPNHLWMNQKDGTFREEGVSRNVAYSQMGEAYAGMGVALGDLDGDLLADLFVTHLSNESHTLWAQGPRGLFRDRTAEAGLMRTRWRGTGWGTLAADFDADGWPDLVLVNGRVHRAPGTTPSPADFWAPYRERNQLLRNAGEGRFEDLSSARDPFCRDAGPYRAVLRGDIDNDGAEDLVVTRIDGPARVYRNVVPDRGHWVQVRAVDPKLNRDAYGAEVVVRAGGRKWLRVATPAESYLSSSSPVLHVGLGTTTILDGFDVVWPDGSREVFPGGPADRPVTLEKGRGTRP